MKRLVLVSLHPAPSPQAVPLACGFLKAALHTLPLEVQLQDVFLNGPLETGLSAILAARPSAVGFSIYLWNRRAARELAGRNREQLPGTLLFCGGPEATADPAGLLGEAVYDAVVVGEGEGPLADIGEALAAGGELTGIPGVATMAEGGISLVPRIPPTELDQLPSPWLGGTLNPSDYSGILWQLSRGCAFRCDFCFDSRDRHGVRRFSLERIEQELRCFTAAGVTQVFVLDSTFNQDVTRAKSILRLIARLAPQIHFHFEVRSEFLDREMAGLFAGVTCSLQIGLQSADPQVLTAVGRHFKPQEFTRRITLLNDSGATFGFDLIYGLPGDTLAGFRSSIDFALGLYPNHLDIFPLALLPGTDLAARAAGLGLQHLPAPPYTLLSSPDMPPDDMARAGRIGSACDIFYTRGKAVAWFNGTLDALGETPSRFLEAFGDWLAARHDREMTERDLDDGQVWQLQRDFLDQAFSRREVRRYLPAVLDLATYHHHYAAALLSPVAPPSRRPKQLLKQPLRPTPGTRTAAFSYDILEILDAGAADVRGFTRHLRQTGSWAVIYPAPDGVRTESLDRAYIRLLELLDGSSSAGECGGRAGLTEQETREFLAFALQEGIVCC